MIRGRLLLAVLALFAAPPADARPNEMRIAEMRDRLAASDTLAWDFVEGITTEVGPRLAGTEAEARGREWAARWLAERGFSNIREEGYAMPVWLRGEERGEIIAPFAQPLVLTALGNSGSTGPAGLEGEVVAFSSLAALAAAPAGSLAGKIAFIDHAMPVSQEGWGYGATRPVRTDGPALAADKGAAATLIASLGTGADRFAHTGDTRWNEGQAPIPAAALALPDAQNLSRMIARADARGESVRLRLVLTPQFAGTARSANLLAEIPGSDPGAGVVLLACHLDSWDLGTGAIDDAAGCGIIAAAAHAAARLGTPRRTIRLLFAGAEENGEWGGKDYAARHAGEPHAVAMESDFGAGRVWRIDRNGFDRELHDRIAAALAPLAIIPGTDTAFAGADIKRFVAQSGTPLLALKQDGSDYFDLHHTANDTLAQIDPAALRQNVAAWAVAATLIADAAGDTRAK